MKAVLGLLALAVVSGSALAADPTLELRSQGLVCEYRTQWVWQGGTLTTQRVLPSLNGYRYSNPVVSLGNNVLSIKVNAGFFYCSHGVGVNAVWARSNPASWAMLGAANSEWFRSDTISTGTYVRGKDGEDLTAVANVPVAQALSGGDLKAYEAGQTVTGSIYIANVNGDFRTPGGIYRLQFAINKTAGASETQLEFVGLGQ